MRFALVAVARVSGDDTAADQRQAKRLMSEGEDGVEHWIEQHYGQQVMCQVCGQSGVVDPGDDNDLVITVAHEGHAFIACEDCLQAFVISGILGMDDDDAERLVSRAVLHLLDRSKTAMQHQIKDGVMQGVVISRSVDALLSERQADATNTSGVSADYKAAMREAFKR